jgi:hypothetical protein
MGSCSFRRAYLESNVENKDGGCTTWRPVLKNITNLYSGQIKVALHKTISPRSDVFGLILGRKFNEFKLIYEDKGLVNWIENWNRDRSNWSNNLNPRFRNTLIEWLSEASDDLKLSSNTLHLTVNYLDRYLNLISLPSDRLQLLGATSLLIASKMEDTIPCKLNVLVDICDGGVTSQQIRIMERQLFQKLGFKLHVPTLYSIVFDIIEREGLILSDSGVSFICFLSELCLTNMDLFKYSSSDVAKALVHLFHDYSGLPNKSSKTNDRYYEILGVIRCMLTRKYCEDIRGIVSKFSNSRNHRIVSIIESLGLN